MLAATAAAKDSSLKIIGLLSSIDGCTASVTEVTSLSGLCCWAPSLNTEDAVDFASDTARLCALSATAALVTAALDFRESSDALLVADEEFLCVRSCCFMLSLRVKALPQVGQ